MFSDTSEGRDEPEHVQPVNLVGTTLIFPDGTSREATADEMARYALGLPVHVELSSGYYTHVIGDAPRCPHCDRVLRTDPPSLSCPDHGPIIQLR